MMISRDLRLARLGRTEQDYRDFISNVNLNLKVNYDDDVDIDVLEKELPPRVENLIHKEHVKRLITLPLLVLFLIWIPVSMIAPFYFLNIYVLCAMVIPIIGSLISLCTATSAGVELVFLNAAKKYIQNNLTSFKKKK